MAAARPHPLQHLDRIQTPDPVRPPSPHAPPLQLCSGLLTCSAHLPPPVVPESFAQCPPPALNAVCSGWPRVWSALRTCPFYGSRTLP